MINMTGCCGPNAFMAFAERVNRAHMAADPFDADIDRGEEAFNRVMDQQDPEVDALKIVLDAHFGPALGEGLSAQAANELVDQLISLLLTTGKDLLPKILDIVTKYLTSRFGMQAQDARSAVIGCGTQFVFGLLARQDARTLILNLLTCLAQSGIAGGLIPGTPTTPGGGAKPTADLFRSVARCGQT